MKRRRVILSDSARRRIRDIDQPTALEPLEKLDRYNLTGVGDVKQLTNVTPPELRLRVGAFRMRFYSNRDQYREIISVTRRSSSYRDL